MAAGAGNAAVEWLHPAENFRQFCTGEKVSSRWKKERKNEAMNFCVYHCPRI